MRASFSCGTSRMIERLPYCSGNMILGDADAERCPTLQTSTVAAASDGWNRGAEAFDVTSELVRRGELLLATAPYSGLSSPNQLEYNMSISSRRTFLKTAAGVGAGTMIARQPLWAQNGGAGGASTRIDAKFMITPEQAWDWHVFKSECGPTYAGSVGWKRFTDFLVSKMTEAGAVDLEYIEIPYDHYIVDDWPDRRTHIYASGVALEKLVTDGTPVPVVASYGMTSGSTPPEGITAQMLCYDPAHPPAASDMSGKILVFQTAHYPDPPYSNSFLDNYTLTDY